ncbi:class I SAM-dependent methyltransferase [Bacillus licheniformis]|uniref:class I SAM-dependent methyltransferase n=1 Tax=Bacillus licheniformis TaxID=1402 RepID=UPI00046F6E53|nr:class I SAM-dependent methyltransferase [Bacillus licheniformis]MCZ0107724.1 class I SAM-dependent methyltransferase [Bacillus licheniformis]TWJ86467.1 Ubiquinone/menaquinone biosynthesis C-methyltransferase UbiE [Bacillus licheniformis]TWJ92086.1 Ubiquinone/menaquinone biosynthesis C-methyltransferase UbiE [Bacillus licheniformis]TWN81943.1 Ubiquinone/menaquinone biosynthesis C-methyltransferase UbiE [Bacillus licheniformis]
MRRLQSLEAIEKVKNGDYHVLRDAEWLKYLVLTEEQNINLERISSLENMPQNPVFLYVEQTLSILEKADIPELEKEIIEEVLIWSEAAKCGQPHKRKEWREKGFQLAIHNIGSAQIYADRRQAYMPERQDIEELIHILIVTHGLVGQYIRGETRYRQFTPLIDWIETSELQHIDIRRVLYVLNKCIIEAVSPALWDSIERDVNRVIGQICTGERNKDWPFAERIRKLRGQALDSGEDSSRYERFLREHSAEDTLRCFFQRIDLWYVESALSSFSFEEFVKIFLLVLRSVNPLSVKHISFEPLMKDMYRDYQGVRHINVYKKRIIEACLKEMSISDLLYGEVPVNEHVSLAVQPFDQASEIVGVTFSFSQAGLKLIEFCQEAEKSPLYERAIVLLYDFFEFRKDSFDRLQNEAAYLSDMNGAEDYKKKIADYAVGERMLDIGAGGGVMLDLLTDQHPEAEVIGIDLSVNVIEELQKRKVREHKPWHVKQADALDLPEYFEQESVDTIVFSSILHELFSYIPYEGKKFNHLVIAQALKSSFDILKPGGRIIIRDGIMTENKEETRRIRFKDPDGMDFLKRYVHDFKGRKVQMLEAEKDAAVLFVNDAMEFLYTYTWGEEAYPHEVQEQFGYFTPSEFRRCIEKELGERANILVFEHYVQEGYEEHLYPKIELTDRLGRRVPLPDSTCFIVIEKKHL